MGIDPGRQLAVFLREIKEHPDDDTPRLILADWLQDQGEPRGEFVFLQVHRRRLAEDDPQRAEFQQRERQLLRRYVFDWLGPLADRASAWTFQRGLLRLEMRGDRLLRPADLVGEPAFGWVEELSLHDVRAEQLEGLAGSPALGQVVGLDLSENRIGDDGLERLLESPDLDRLWTLSLAGARIGQRGACALARSSGLRNLRALDLSRNRIADAGALALADSPHLHRLVRLDVRDNSLNLEGVSALRARFGDAVLMGRSREAAQ